MKKGLFHERWLEYPLRTPLRRTLFACGIALLVLPLTYKSVRIATAGALAAFQKPAYLRTAIAFDPANPRLYRRLGTENQTSLNANAAHSVALFRQAVALDPRNGWNWERLGQACESAGDESCATRAFARALALNPMSPQIEWLAANHDLLIGAPEKAAAHFRRLLELDPQYARAVFATCVRAYGDPRFVGDHILPARSDAPLKLEYLNFLTARGDFPLAGEFWAQLVSSRMPFTFPQADTYLEKLISTGRIANAVQVWRDLKRLRILRDAGGASTGNLVFNPGFEQGPVNAGFGWRTWHVRYVNTQFADPDAHRGSRCLRIDFVVPENETSEPVYQLVPVAPNQTYTLSAWVRSEQITSHSGPLLRVADPDHPNCAPAETRDTVGTTSWHEVSVTSTTCSDTQLLRLSVWRAHSYDFPNAIGGHFWLDDVSLVPRSQSKALAASAGNR